MTPDEALTRILRRFADTTVLDQGEVALIARLIFQEMADCIYEAHLNDGSPVRHCDPIGFKEWLEQLAEAARTPRFATRARITPIGNFCPDCGHVHLDDSECSFPIGGERMCRCERKVSA
jgi:hypothetical protein